MLLKSRYQVLQLNMQELAIIWLFLLPKHMQNNDFSWSYQIPFLLRTLKLDGALEGDLKARPLALLDLVLVEIEVVCHGFVFSSFD